jgi:hypothetical protein
LTSHFWTHTGEKPFVCIEQGCGATFTRAAGLRKHYYKLHIKSE